MTCRVVRVLLLLRPSAQAQAQECLIEKSTKGEQRPKPGVVARLASKVCAVVQVLRKKSLKQLSIL